MIIDSVVTLIMLVLADLAVGVALSVLSFGASLAAMFFFNDAATTETYTRSLHDALPIYTGIAVAYIAVNASLSYAARRLDLSTRQRYGQAVVTVQRSAVDEAA